VDVTVITGDMACNKILLDISGMTFSLQ